MPNLGHGAHIPLAKSHRQIHHGGGEGLINKPQQLISYSKILVEREWKILNIIVFLITFLNMLSLSPFSLSPRLMLLITALRYAHHFFCIIHLILNYISPDLSSLLLLLISKHKTHKIFFISLWY